MSCLRAAATLVGLLLASVGNPAQAQAASAAKDLNLGFSIPLPMISPLS